MRTVRKGCKGKGKVDIDSVTPDFAWEFPWCIKNTVTITF
jgi:hypothetical protein